MVVMKEIVKVNNQGGMIAIVIGLGISVILKIILVLVFMKQI